MDERVKLISAYADHQRRVRDTLGREVNQIPDRRHNHMAAESSVADWPMGLGGLAQHRPRKSRRDSRSVDKVAKIMDAACWAGWLALCVGLARAAAWFVWHS